MGILYTNVFSELMRATPDQRVFDWVDRQKPRMLYTTAVVRAEILYGIALLAEGRRKQAQADAAEAWFNEDFAGRVLPFDALSAGAYAKIAASRRQRSRQINGFDALIAAAALTAGAALAARDPAGFEGSGLSLINPWQAV